MDIDESKKEYEDLRNELYKRDLSNTEAYDKAILSLSSAGLAVSLTLIQSLFPVTVSKCTYFLSSSWYLFSGAIILTIASFMASQLGINKQIDIAHEYYIEDNEEALNKKNIPAKITQYLNYCSGILFISAIISVVLFATINLNKGG